MELDACQPESITSSEHVVVLELFCGTAGLSAALRQLGLDVVAVDKSKPKAPKALVTKLDLTSIANQLLVLSWIRNPQVKAVFLAPPCGTASAARNIQKVSDTSLPKPLRSAEFPDGLPDLHGFDFLRVEQSNILYNFSATVFDLCCSLDKLCICENPRDSLFWSTTPWLDREHQARDCAQCHQACAYGSARPKWTKLVANFSEIEQVNGICDGKHQHEPWGYEFKNGKRVYATALEVHYPVALCAKVAATIALALQRRHIIVPSQIPVNLAARTLAQNQPITNKIAPLVPEFKCKCVAIFLMDQCLWPLNHTFLDNAKVLQKFQVGGECLQTLHANIHDQCKLWNLDVQVNLDGAGLNFPCVTTLQLVGIPWSETEFVEQAIKAKHPLSLESAVPQQLLDATQYTVTHDDADVARMRAEFFMKWTKRAVQLDCEERMLKQSMHGDVADAVKGKRILLFEEMLRATAFPDLGVVDELRHGSDLTGDIPLTNMLPGKFEPALISETELCANAARIRTAAVKEVRSSGDEEIDKIVWQKTLEEVEKGWLVGPLDEKHVPKDRPLSRRFGLKQRHGKVRLIDDYSESGVNSCVTVSESPMLHTVDVACAMMMVWFSACKEHGLDSAMAVRTFDLASAYRQVGLSESGQRFAFLRVFNPESGKASFFRSKVLPFGAVRSVHSFLRLARALWWLGVKGCCILWTSFYDDFISFSKPFLVGSTEQAVTALFKLLGWIFAEEGDKAQPFDMRCSALGVVFNLGSASTGKALVCNTESRRLELCEDIAQVVSGGRLSSKQAQRLRGRMQFAESQLFGRTGRRCLRVLTDFAEGRRFHLTAKDKFFLSMFHDLLEKNILREVSAMCSENVLVFTDACYERDHPTWPCGLGGVLFAGNKVYYFSLAVDVELRAFFGEDVKKQIIFEVETVAALLAVEMWQSFFGNKRTVLFVDNEGTKFSFLKGLSDNTCVDKMAECFANLESRLHSLIWLARVPSQSNVADPPSRGITNTPSLLNAVDMSGLAAEKLKAIVMQLKKMGETAA